MPNHTAPPLSHFRLDGLAAAATGGANGIGRATATLMREAWATVALLDREAPAPAAAEIGTIPIVVDVTEEAAMEDALAQVVAQAGRLDVLVNNAGLALRRTTTELPLPDWNQVVAVNLTDAFLCARAAARHMIAA